MKRFMETLFLVALLALSIHAKSMDIVNELLIKSGIENQIASMPKSIENVLKMQGIPLEDGIKKMIDSTYTKDRFITPLSESVSKELSSNDIKKLLRWYDSELGQKFVEADTKATDPQFIMDMMSKKELSKVDKEKSAIFKSMIDDKYANITQQEKDIALKMLEIVYGDFSAKELETYKEESQKEYAEKYSYIVNKTMSEVGMQLQMEFQQKIVTYYQSMNKAK
jgi:hypothetical protein